MVLFILLQLLFGVACCPAMHSSKAGSELLCRETKSMSKRYPHQSEAMVLAAPCHATEEAFQDTASNNAHASYGSFTCKARVLASVLTCIIRNAFAPMAIYTKEFHFAIRIVSICTIQQHCRCRELPAQPPVEARKVTPKQPRFCDLLCNTELQLSCCCPHALDRILFV